VNKIFDYPTLLLLIFIGLGFFDLMDIRKRVFPNKKIKELYNILIVIPPILGALIYYFLIVNRNKYARDISREICPKCKTPDRISLYSARERIGLGLILIALTLLNIAHSQIFYVIIMVLAICGLYLSLKYKFYFKCDNCGNKWGHN
jgi:hypothetical protein